MCALGGLFLNCNVHMALCRVNGHKAGGILIRSESEQQYESKICRCKLFGNWLVGIYAAGSDAKPYIYKNNIIGTEGPGIHCYIANLAQVLLYIYIYIYIYFIDHRE